LASWTLTFCSCSFNYYGVTAFETYDTLSDGKQIAVGIKMKLLVEFLTPYYV
jgi:hypothetical protein